MKRALALILVLFLTACGGNSGGGSAEDVELIVFAAASLQETLEECGALYREERPQVRLVFQFDSSGTLKTQIEEGAECDVFISAGQKQMDQLDSAAGPDVNTEGLDLVARGTRFDLLENKVVLTVPEGNPAGIHSFDELKAALEAGDILLAVGNGDVPVGQYTQRIFAFWGLDEAALNAAGVLTYGSNAREVTTQVAEGLVDGGIIYATDARSAGLTVVDTATAEMCGRVIYPAAVLSNSRFPGEARAFLEFLRTPGAGAVLESVGFTPLNN